MADMHRFTSLEEPLPQRKDPEQQSRRVAVFTMLGVFVTAVTFSIIIVVLRDRRCTVEVSWLSESGMTDRITSAINAIDANRIGELVQEYSRFPHIAGSKRNSVDLANLTAARFRSYGFDDVRQQVLPVLLANFTYRSVNATTADGTVRFECRLQETNVLNETMWDDALPPANGYSGAGFARGPVVWVNYGRKSDFDAISNVNLTGAIVVVRYGRIFRGDKARFAELRGAAGVLIVNDPANVMEGPSYPNGPWARNSSVQRGSVYLGEGDPLTPEWPSQFGGPTLAIEDLFDSEKMGGLPLPRIPVQPMSVSDARQVLWDLQGAPLPEGWNTTGFLDLFFNGIGPGPAYVSMEVQRTLQVYNVTNVIATIYGGVEPDRIVAIGSHRDAWTYGAVDPISGHSVIQEIARSLGALHRGGWIPRRTLQFCSWDAEEWAIIGSIEYVEGQHEQLRQRAVAYINMDTAVTGHDVLSGGGSPLLKRVFTAALKDVNVPGTRNTLDTIANPYDGTVGSGSDFVGFIQQAGVPVLDSGVSSNSGMYSAVYHSNYDSYYWQSTFGDPGFLYHKAMAQLHCSILIRLADSVLIPFNTSDYAANVQQWVREFSTDPKNSFASFTFMQSQADTMSRGATTHESRVAALASQLAASSTALSPFAVRAANDLSMGLERVFLASTKETGQSWYRHVLFTPSSVNSYAASVMPLVADALATGNASVANFAIGRVSQFIGRAGNFLNSLGTEPS